MEEKYEQLRFYALCGRDSQQRFSEACTEASNHCSWSRYFSIFILEE